MVPREVAGRQGSGAGAGHARGSRAAVAGLLELAQHLLRPLDDRPRQAGQLGHVDAVAAVGAAGQDAVEEDHPPPLFGHGHVVVLHPRQEGRQLHQLVVVGGEEGLGGPLGVVWRYSTTALAMAMPS